MKKEALGIIVIILSLLILTSAYASPTETCYSVHGEYENMTNYGLVRTFVNVIFAINDSANNLISEYKWKDGGNGYETPPSDTNWHTFQDKEEGAESYFFTDAYTNNTRISGTIYFSAESKDKNGDGKFNWTLYEYSNGTLLYYFGSQVWDAGDSGSPIDSELNITNHTVTAGNRLMMGVMGKLNAAPISGGGKLEFKLDESGLGTGTNTTVNCCNNIQDTYRSFFVIVLSEEVIIINLTNTSWGNWYNTSACYVNDTIDQERNLTQYDSCGEIADQTFFEYQSAACDYCTPDWYEINTSCQPDDTITGWYNDSNSCYELNPANNTYSCDYIISTEFNINFSNITNLVADYGKIDFSETISINRSLDLDLNIEIANNLIYINTTALPEFNKSAVLTLHNLTFVDPIILKDSSECSSCSKISYINKTLVFEVTGFSNYSASEGPYCGDGICTETCSTCSADCGNCPSGSGRRRYTYYKPPVKKECIENWICSEWSDCNDKIRKRACKDTNNCNTLKNKPDETESCKKEEPEEKPEYIPEITQDELTPVNTNPSTEIKVVETKQGSNAFYMVPVVFMSVILVTLILSKKASLTPKFKMSMAFMQISLTLVLISFLTSYFTGITGFFVKNTPVGYNVFNNLSNNYIRIFAEFVMLTSFFTLFKKSKPKNKIYKEKVLTMLKEVHK